MPFTSWPTTWRLKWYRTAKYKQRRQLKTRPLLSTLENIQIGACTGLSYWWIQRHRSHPTESAKLRLESLNTDQAFRNHDHLAGIFNSAGDYPTRIRSVAKASLGVSEASVVVNREEDFVNFRELLTHLTTHPGHHVLLTHISNYATSHVCALHSTAAQMTFFDPNLGEFSVSQSNWGAFFQHFVAQYRTYVSAAGDRTDLRFDFWLCGSVG